MKESIPFSLDYRRALRCGMVALGVMASSLALSARPAFAKRQPGVTAPKRTFFTGESITIAPDLPVQINVGNVAINRAAIEKMVAGHQRESVDVKLQTPDGELYSEVRIDATSIAGNYSEMPGGELSLPIDPHAPIVEMVVEDDRHIWTGHHFRTEEISRTTYDINDWPLI